MIETLKCKFGHTFERERRRGQKPKVCPAHLSASKKNSLPEGTLPLGINSVASSALSEPLSRVSDAMLEILTGDKRLPREWVRKADYVVGQLDDPRILAHRDENDLSMLVGVQKDLVRQAQAFA